MEEYRVALNQNEKDLLAEEKAQAAIGAYEDRVGVGRETALAVVMDYLNPPAVTEEERKLIEVGRHVAAIKSYRERTGHGLSISKCVCDRCRDKFGLNEEEKKTIENNAVINAIKMYRERTGATLATARDLCVSYQKAVSPSETSEVLIVRNEIINKTTGYVARVRIYTGRYDTGDQPFNTRRVAYMGQAEYPVDVARELGVKIAMDLVGPKGEVWSMHGEPSVMKRWQ